jgi:hypothetical protein
LGPSPINGAFDITGIAVGVDGTGVGTSISSRSSWQLISKGKSAIVAKSGTRILCLIKFNLIDPFDYLVWPGYFSEFLQFFK